MFLKYADMWDMPIDGASDEKKIPHWFGNLAWVVIGGVFGRVAKEDESVSQVR